MTILTIRTDKPEAEIGLYVDKLQVGHETWLADRELSTMIFTHITKLLELHHKKLQSIGAIIIYAGPGSFTGLRIGMSVANALAYSLEIAAVGTTGDGWVAQGFSLLDEAQDKTFIPLVPLYGAPVHTTQPRK